jgi:hypothetical protein
VLSTFATAGLFGDCGGAVAQAVTNHAIKATKHRNFGIVLSRRTSQPQISPDIISPQPGYWTCPNWLRHHLSLGSLRLASRSRCRAPPKVVLGSAFDHPVIADSCHRRAADDGRRSLQSLRQRHTPHAPGREGSARRKHSGLVRRPIRSNYWVGPDGGQHRRAEHAGVELIYFVGGSMLVNSGLAALSLLRGGRMLLFACQMR